MLKIIIDKEKLKQDFLTKIQSLPEYLPQWQIDDMVNLLTTELNKEYLLKDIELLQNQINFIKNQMLYKINQRPEDGDFSKENFLKWEKWYKAINNFYLFNS